MRPKVLTFVEYYLPGFKAGGPARTIANLVERLGDEIEFRIVTRDRDLGDYIPYGDVRVGQWQQLGKASVFYAPPGQLTLGGIRRLMRATDHDRLYLNSLFSPRMTILPLLASRAGLAPARPTIVAPRGELGGGALSLKARKKRTYLSLARFAGLYDKVVWQASSSAEAADIVTTFGRDGAVVIAPNFPTLAKAPGAADPSDATRLKIVLVGRVSPMKNLDFALRVLQRVQIPVDFTLFGPKEDLDYWSSCTRLLAQLPPNIHFIDGGPLEPQLVPATLAAFDLLFLPSRGENFGHAIAEGLQVGLPALISDRTPWRGLAEKGLGDDLPLEDIDGFVAAIERQHAMSAAERQTQRATVLAFAKEMTRAAGTMAAHRELFGLAPVTGVEPQSQGS